MVRNIALFASLLLIAVGAYWLKYRRSNERLKHVLLTEPDVWNQEKEKAFNRNLSHLKVSDRVFDGLDLRNVNLDGSTMEHVVFKNCDLTGASLSGSRFEHVEFDHSRIDGAVVSGALWADVRLTDSSINDVYSEGSVWRDVTLDRSSAVNADFSYSKFDRVEIRDSYLKGTFFIFPEIQSLYIYRSNLQYAALRHIGPRLPIRIVEARNCPSTLEEYCREGDAEPQKR